jgi:hypothetical protein
MNSFIGCVDKLKTYKDLLDSGVITQEEFDNKQKQIRRISMYCSKCGSEIEEGNMFCGNCGNRVVSEVDNNHINDSNVRTNNEDCSSGGLNIISFLIPLVGLVLYCTFIKEYPVKAKGVGTAAILSVIIYTLLIVAFSCTAAIL